MTYSVPRPGRSTPPSRPGCMKTALSDRPHGQKVARLVGLKAGDHHFDALLEVGGSVVAGQFGSQGAYPGNSGAAACLGQAAADHTGAPRR